VDFVIAARTRARLSPPTPSRSSREESFIDWAKSRTASLYAFRGLLFGTRLASVVAPKLPTFLIDRAARRFPSSSTWVG